MDSKCYLDDLPNEMIYKIISHMAAPTNFCIAYPRAKVFVSEHLWRRFKFPSYKELERRINQKFTSYGWFCDGYCDLALRHRQAGEKCANGECSQPLVWKKGNIHRFPVELESFDLNELKVFWGTIEFFVDLEDFSCSQSNDRRYDRQIWEGLFNDKRPCIYLPPFLIKQFQSNFYKYLVQSVCVGLQKQINALSENQIKLETKLKEQETKIWNLYIRESVERLCEFLEMLDEVALDKFINKENEKNASPLTLTKKCIREIIEYRTALSNYLSRAGREKFKIEKIGDDDIVELKYAGLKIIQFKRKLLNIMIYLLDQGYGS